MRQWRCVALRVVVAGAVTLTWTPQTFAQVRTPPARPPVARPTTTRPAPATPALNVIVLVVNEWGWQDLSVPLFRDTTDANRRYHTPAIAQLAARSVTFTDAYASAPVGSPSIVAMLTGRAPASSAVSYTVLAPDRDASAKFPMVLPPAWNVNGLSATANTPRAFTSATLPRLFQTAGYRTIHVGRTDWSAAGTKGGDAKAIGFDESYGGARPSDSLTFDALRALNAARASKKPFFLFLAYDAIRYARPDDAIYASLVAGVDSSVGSLTAFLESNGITDSTIVVLTSSTGGVASGARAGMRYFQNAPLQSGRGSAYEGGVRVPLFVRWPRVGSPGRRVSAPVMLDDLFPTLLRATQLTNTAQYLRDVTAKDLTSTLDNTAPVSPERALLWHFPHFAGVDGPGMEPYSAIRVGRWKLIYFHSGSRYELYDLVSDPGESRERSLKEPAIASRLSEVLRSSLSTAKAQMPIDAAYGRPFALPGRILVPTPPH